MNIAIITGASSGIGAEFVRQIVRERGVYGSVPFQEIWIIARRQDRLEELKNSLEDERIRIFPLDITKQEDLQVIKNQLVAPHLQIGLLVNCAGSGSMSQFSAAPSEEIRTMLSLNCTALAELTSICLPYMIPNGSHSTYASGPRIIQVASSAGFAPQPGFAAYAASKSFVISFSRALQAELKVSNIASTAVCPGPVATEFFTVASHNATDKPTGFKALFTTTVAPLVKKSLAASRKGKAMYVHGFSQKAYHVLAKILPHRFLIFIMQKLNSQDSAPEETTTLAPSLHQGAENEVHSESPAVETAPAPAGIPEAVAPANEHISTEKAHIFTLPHLFKDSPKEEISDRNTSAETNTTDRLEAKRAEVNTSDEAAQILARYRKTP